MKIDIHSNAVVFISRDETGRVVGYQKRFLRPSDPHMKTQTSFGFKAHKNIVEFPNTGDIVVCEGPFTALSAWHYGFHAIATFGAGISTEQLEKIARRLKNNKVIVAFDNDEAGSIGESKIFKYFYWLDVELWRMSAEEGNDLNDSWQEGKGYKLEGPIDVNPAIPKLTVW